MAESYLAEDEANKGEDGYFSEDISSENLSWLDKARIIWGNFLFGWSCLFMAEAALEYGSRIARRFCYYFLSAHFMTVFK